MGLKIEVDKKSKTIDIYGGDSACTIKDPYWIPFDRVWEPWVAHLSAKNWVSTDDLHDIEEALNRIRQQQSARG